MHNSEFENLGGDDQDNEVYIKPENTSEKWTEFPNRKVIRMWRTAEHVSTGFQTGSIKESKLDILIS